MKNIFFAAAALAALLMAAGSTGFAQQNAANSDTAKVWAGEEAYWRDVKTHNVTDYMALWADDFNGWPISDAHPIHRRDIAPFVTKNGSLSEVASYEMHRESVEVHGPVIITYYRVTVRRRNADGSVTPTTYRMTHTWMKRGGRWQIVGSMSAVDPTPAMAANP